MFVDQDRGSKQHGNFKKSCQRLFLIFCAGVLLVSHTSTLFALENPIQGIESSKNIKVTEEQLSRKPFVYYLNIADFAQSFIEIPTSNVAVDSTTITSKYLAGRAALYDQNNLNVGTCSASFLCMQNEEGIYTDISNYISVDSGLVVTWFTPTTLINLELDSIINSMVTECIVVATTKVGVNPFYGQTFNLVVSSDNQKIYFVFARTGTVF